MALTQKEKRSLRRMCCNRRTSEALISLIDSGSADAVTPVNERCLKTALANPPQADALIDNLENGTATVRATEKSMGRAIGSLQSAAGICDEIDTLS